MALALMIAFISLQLPTVELSDGAWLALPPTMFRSTDGLASDYPTTIQLRADDDFLHVAFECERDEFVHENYLRQHGEPIYNQEVFELFIAAGESDPVQYLEFEINPNDATWIGKITNPRLGEIDMGISTEMVSHEESGVRHQVQKGDSSWSGSFSIPWSLVSETKASHYRLNFYRIVSKKSHPAVDWVCDEANAEFICWSSTMSGDTPAFHRPKRFGHLILRP